MTSHTFKDGGHDVISPRKCCVNCHIVSENEASVAHTPICRSAHQFLIYITFVLVIILLYITFVITYDNNCTDEIKRYYELPNVSVYMSPRRRARFVNKMLDYLASLFHGYFHLANIAVVATIRR